MEPSPSEVAAPPAVDTTTTTATTKESTVSDNVGSSAVTSVTTTTTTSSSLSPAAGTTVTTRTTTNSTHQNDNNNNNTMMMMKEKNGETATAFGWNDAEAKVGILEYLSPSVTGFSAVLKGRYSDFVVHEVGLDGQLAQFTSTELPMEDRHPMEQEQVEGANNSSTSGRKRKQPDGASTDTRDNVWWDTTICIPLQQWMDTKVAQQVVQFLKEANDNRETTPCGTTTTSKTETTPTTAATLTTETNTSTDYGTDTNNGNGNNVVNDTIAVDNSNDTKNGNNHSNMFIVLPPIPDKQHRRQVHEWIRTNLAFCARADTQPQSTQIRIWKACYESNMPHHQSRRDHNSKGGGSRGGGGGNNNKRQKNTADGGWNRNNNNIPLFLQFCLYKENMDTTAAMKELGRACHPVKLRLGYAGMKDKRGITTQFCTVHKQMASFLLDRVNKYCSHQHRRNNNPGNHQDDNNNNNTKGVSVLRIGNFRYSSQELCLGMLQGNRFQVALRNVQLNQPKQQAQVSSQPPAPPSSRTNDDDQDDGAGDSRTDSNPLGPTTSDLSPEQPQEVQQQGVLAAETALRQAANAFATNGFINYFGMQRFGKFGDTHQVGIHVLQGDFKSAIDVIMAPKQPPDRAEQARRKWKRRFTSVVAVVAGASVTSDTTKNNNNNNNTSSSQEKKQAKAEADCARQIQREFGRFMTCENAILQSLIRKPLDYRRAFTCIPRTMRMMFVHAVQSLWWNLVATRRIQIVHDHQNQEIHDLQVMPGDLVLVNNDAVATASPVVESQSASIGNTPNKFQHPHVVTDEDVQAKRYTMADVVLPLMGSKSTLPQNETGEYCEQLLKQQGLTLSMFGKVADHEVASKGDYRKLLCVPSDVDYVIVPYQDPMEPLIQTDLMKLDGVDLRCRTKLLTNEGEARLEMKEPASSGPNADAVAGGKTRADVALDIAFVDEVMHKNAPTPLLAMVISFTLPPSAYATIALRELMKRPTSFDYQKDLKLDGPSADDKDES